MFKAHGNISRNLLVATLLVLTGLAVGVLFTARWDLTASSEAQSVAPPVNYRFASTSFPMLTESGESPFVAVAERVAPTVVNITTDRKVDQSDPFEDFFRDSPFWEYFHRNRGETPRKRETVVPSTGSGIIISRDGYILTNNHVVADADKVTVKVQNGKEYKATIIGKDPETDVALIKVDRGFDAREVALTGNSDSIKVGDWAIAIGNPLALDWTLTVGVISAKGRSNLAIAGGGPSYQNFIQTDASINFGNSGGPLCNIHGEVIGVNTAINPSGQGIGFAIPMNMAMKVVDQLRSSGTVARGYLGMLPRDLTPELRSALSVPEDEGGVFVERVDKSTPADDGGLRAGDVILEIDGQKISDPAQFRIVVADHSPGTRINARVWRSGSSQNLSFVLGDRAKLVSLFGKDEQEKSSKETWLGIQVEPVTEEVARALELDELSGVIVTDVDPAGAAAQKLRERDVIIEIDRKTVESILDFKRIAAELKDSKKAVLFRIVRNGQKTFEAIEP
ncbi:Do family serine endopeptidase [candidate division KSB1 bacterium]|nr:MAG: Do family serine endopeptidase [candidate division KSB1 bacterium]